MSLAEKLTGKEAGRLSNTGFRAMALAINCYARLVGIDKRLDEFGIQEGFTVIDYGCGTGNYIKRASRLVGEKGKVLAVDIHPLSEKHINKKARKHGLHNVTFTLIDGNSCPIEDNIADMIYALEMFHMVKDHRAFLGELHRLLKSEGFLIIDDGHQTREESKAKIIASGLWEIVIDDKGYIKCLPK